MWIIVGLALYIFLGMSYDNGNMYDWTGGGFGRPSPEEQKRLDKLIDAEVKPKAGMASSKSATEGSGTNAVVLPAGSGVTNAPVK